MNITLLMADQCSSTSVAAALEFFETANVLQHYSRSKQAREQDGGLWVAIAFNVGVIVPALASVFGIFLVRQYARSIPDELLEAARIDGAGEMRIFFQIVLPMLKPVLVTLAIFTFMGAWNDFMWPLIVLSDDSLQTLPVALAGLSREHVMDYELMMAGSVVTILPVLLLFLVLQRYYIQGLLLGSVKG